MTNKYRRLIISSIILITVVSISINLSFSNFIFSNDVESDQSDESSSNQSDSNPDDHENEAAANSKKSVYAHMLDFEKTLAISRPNSSISVESDNYFVTGTCDPEKPLYVNNEIVKDTTSGIFGVEVNLKSDKNTFTFKQDDNEKTVYIFKNTPQSMIKKDPTKNSNNICINTKPPYPSSYEVVKNKKLYLSCPAPKGAKVTANIDGVTFEMSPNKDTKSDYIQFTGEANFNNKKYGTDYYNAGPVRYKVTYNNETTDTISDGYVIFSNNVNELSTKFIEVSKSRASIFEKPNCESNVLTIIKRGCLLETDPSLENEEWFKLKDFGWIMKSATCPADPSSDINNTISDISFDMDERQEKLILSGTSKPNFATTYNDNSLTIRLYHTKEAKIDNEIYKKSNLINSISIDEYTTYLDIKLEFKPDIHLSGYNVEYDDNNTVIYLKRPIDHKKSLENVSIMLDAGHGGFDNGAPGLLGNLGGPTEKDFNLAYTLSLKDKLEQLGANVSLTRSNDSNISLNNIANQTEDEKPDFFISLHGDSLDENINPSKVSGYSVLYNNKEISSSFAQKVNDQLSKQNILPSKGCNVSEHYVIKNTLCPSILIEIAIITNPKDVSSLISQENIDKFIDAISDAITSYVN